MVEEDSSIEITPIIIVIIVINVLIILISLYLSILYIKSKEFHSYSCGYILVLSFSLLIDNIMRLIPISSDEKYKAFHYIQAFILASLDKFILLILVVQIFIIYLGIMKTNFYHNHKKEIFFSTFFGSLAISLLIGGLYLLYGTVKYGLYYYAGGDEKKQIYDTIFNSVFLLFNTFFCVILILNIALKKEQISNEVVTDDKALDHDLIKMILMFIVNSLMYIESYLIIWDKLPVPDDYIDLVYTITCLIINLIYAINKLVIDESKKIFCKCCIKEEEKTNMKSTFYRELPNRPTDYSQ